MKSYIYIEREKFDKQKLIDLNYNNEKIFLNVLYIYRTNLYFNFLYSFYGLEVSKIGSVGLSLTFASF